MARVRQARRCHAHRSDGQPCKAYAMIGAKVCRAHGGAARQVRKAALREITEADAQRAFDVAYARYMRELHEWQVKRVATASVLLGMPVTDLLTSTGRVNEALMAWCRLQHGRPDGLESAPTMRVDRRFAVIRGRAISVPSPREIAAQEP